MSDNMKIKIGALLFFVPMDIGFFPRFHNYNTANKITVIVFYLITVLIILSLIKEIKKEMRKANEHQALIQELVANIRSGVIPRIERCSIFLRNGEFACSELETHLSVTKTQAVGTENSGSGVTFRVNDTRQYHSGSGRSRIIYKNVTQKYPGKFIITNQRIVFLNTQRGFEIPLRNLTAISSSGKYLTIQSAFGAYNIFVNDTILFEELIRALINN